MGLVSVPLPHKTFPRSVLLLYIWGEKGTDCGYEGAHEVAIGFLFAKFVVRGGGSCVVPFSV